MTFHRIAISAWMTALLLCSLSHSAAQILKANNNTSLDQGGSWVGGIAPNSSSVAAWDATVATAANCTNTLAISENWGGIVISNPAAAVKIITNNAPTISIGASGINMSNATVDLWIAPALTTVADQTWAIGNGLMLTLGEAGRNVTIANNVTLAGSVSFPDAIIINTGESLTVPDGSSLASTITNNAVTSITANGAVYQTGGTVIVGRSDSTSDSPKATLAIGSSGAGIYNISGGSLIDGSTTSDGRIDIGTGAGVLGTLKISGNSSAQFQSLYVANGGNGIINITNGSMTVAISPIRIGTASNGGTGAINVYGGTVSAVAGINIQHSTATGADSGMLNLYGGSVYVGGVLNVPNGLATGTLNVIGGLLVVTNNMNLPNNSSGTGIVNLMGGTIMVSSIVRNAAGSGTLVLNGGTLKPSGSNSSFITSGVTMNVGTNGALIDTTNFNITILSPLLNGTGGGMDGGLTKLGTGTLTLAGISGTYNGNTLVNAGTLALTAANAIADSTNISISGGAQLDVSGLSSVLTIGPSQTLTGGGVTGTINGNLNMGTGSLALNYTNGTSALTVTGGTFTLTNNVVTVTVFGAALAAGSYQLISPGSGGSVSGVMSNSVLTVNGAGEVAGSTALLQITGGGLYLLVIPSGSVSTTTTLSSSINPSAYGENVTFTATVNPAPTNGESVTFEDGSAILGTGTLSGGVATFITGALSAGSDSITAVYAGDGVYLNSTGDQIQTVQPLLTAVALSNGTNFVIQGSSGLSNGTYYVLSSTNVGLPLTNWTMIGGSNLFDANGNFSFTNVIMSGLPAQFFALSLQSQNLSAANSDILQALQNTRDEGFNSYLASPGGLYINWIYTNTPPVSTNDVNINYNGEPDPTPTLRHDPDTDIVLLADLVLYKQLHPLDTQFDAEINLYTNICFSPNDDNFIGNPDQRGWVYWVLQEIISGVPALAGADNAQADNFYKIFTNNIDKNYNGQVTPLYIDWNTNDTAGMHGTYTVNLVVEDGCVLIVNGQARGLTNYIRAGEMLIAFAQSNAYSSTLNMWADTMGNLFATTNHYGGTVNPPGQQVIYNTSEEASEIGEMTEALCRAEAADPGKGYGPLALSVLDKLDPETNSFGLWDTVYGGYFADLILNGTNIQNPSLTTSVNTSYKEVGRAAIIIRSYIFANQLAGANYDTNSIMALNTANLNSYYTAGHGWVYQMNPDYSLYLDTGSGYSVLQNWVTSESIGHAVRAMLTYELAPVWP